MPKFRPIIREPRSSQERSEAAELFIHNRMLAVGPTAHPGILMTVPATAGVQVKGELGGGFFNPPSNRKAR